MKSRSLLVLFSFATYAVICLNGCKKNPQDSLPSELKLSMFSITDAKQWYSVSGNHQASFSNARNDTFKNKLGKFTPLWDKALNIEDDKYYIVESPLKFDNAPGYVVKKADKSLAVTNGSTRLLVLKDKQTGEMASALMHIHSFTGSGAEKISYGKRDDFSGRIFFTDINGNFINGWEYEKGNVTGKSKVTAGNRSGYRLAPDDLGGDACTSYTVYILMRWCLYDIYGNATECTPWEVLFSYPENTCPSSGDGAIEPPPPLCSMTLDEAQNTINALSGSQSSWVRYATGGATTDANGVTRESVSFEFPIFTLHFISYDIRYTGHGSGIRYKLTPTDSWKWEFVSKKILVIKDHIYPACWVDNMQTNISDFIISADGQVATGSVYYNLTIKLSCLLGQTIRVFTGTHPVNVYAGLY